MRKLLCYMLFALAAAACIYPYEAELPSDIPQRLVVYGDIIIGEATQIELGYVRPLDQSIGDSPRVPQGSVRIECDNGKYYLGKTRGDGRFTFDTEEAAEDARYRILVKLKDGREYTMPWTGVNQAPEITDLYYKYDQDNMMLYCSLDGRDSISNFSWTYDEVWEYHAYFMPDYLYQGGGKYKYVPKFKDYYYCWGNSTPDEPVMVSVGDLSVNHIEDNNFLTINLSDDKISYIYSLNLVVRGLSSEAMTYLQHVRDFSKLTGDLFSPTPSEMRGNLFCVTDPDEPVVGYVSVCELASRRLFVNTTGIYRSKVNPDDLLFAPAPDEKGVLDYDWYFQFFSPVKMEGKQGPMLWAPKRCVDCREWGGTKQKPEWWPNDDE